MLDRPNWSEVQSRLSNLPHWGLASFAVRSARRLWPTILDCEADYGPETREWLAVCDATLRMVEHFAARQPVSRFTLDLAAELARATALVAANTARQVGYRPSAHVAELALAAAAMSADVARATDLIRAARITLQVAQTATNGLPVNPEQSADLFSLEQGEPMPPLWPSPEPVHLRDARLILRNITSPLIKFGHEL